MKRILKKCISSSINRRLSSSSSLSSSINDKKETIKFYFIEAKDGCKIAVNGVIGKTVLDVALDHDIDIEGACGGELACSTCHCILSKELYDRLPSKKEEEEDMLDLAYGLKPTSRYYYHYYYYYYYLNHRHHHYHHYHYYYKDYAVK